MTGSVLVVIAPNQPSTAPLFNAQRHMHGSRTLQNHNASSQTLPGARSRRDPDTAESPFPGSR